MKTILATAAVVVAFSTLTACVSVEREPETVSSTTTTRETTIGVPSSATTVERTTVY